MIQPLKRDVQSFLSSVENDKKSFLDILDFEIEKNILHVFTYSLIKMAIKEIYLPKGEKLSLQVLRLLHQKFEQSMRVYLPFDNYLEREGFSMPSLEFDFDSQLSETVMSGSYIMSRYSNDNSLKYFNEDFNGTYAEHRSILYNVIFNILKHNSINSKRFLSKSLYAYMYSIKNEKRRRRDILYLLKKKENNLLGGIINDLFFEVLSDFLKKRSLLLECLRRKILIDRCLQRQMNEFEIVLF